VIGGAEQACGRGLIIDERKSAPALDPHQARSPSGDVYPSVVAANLAPPGRRTSPLKAAKLRARLAQIR